MGLIPETSETPGRRKRSRRTRLLLFLAAVVATVAIARVLGRIDWEVVGEALTHLSWWQPFVLVVVLVLRQVGNAAPLACYIPGVSLYRATVNDLSASTVSVVAPPPADMALRIAMFRSWGLDSSQAVAGTVMNTVTFFFVRFASPFIGFVLLIVTGRSVGLRYLEVISILAAAAILVAVLLVARTDRWATLVGLHTGRVARLVRRSVDPAAWAAACVKFRKDMASGLGRGFPRAVAAQCGSLAAETLLLVLCLRFVGVTAGQASLMDISIAFMFAYPFTIFVMSGLGIVDMLVVASLVESGGDLVQEPAIAALIIWRVFTIAGPNLLGLGALAVWRRS